MTPHEALKAAVEERMRLAREAGEIGWAHTVILDDRTGPEHFLHHNDRVTFVGFGEDETIRPAEAGHIAANDPAFVIRQCERDLKVLERHAGYKSRRGQTWEECTNCQQVMPCDDIEALAEVYQINLGVSDDS